MISTKTARRKAFQQGQKDFHAGWTEEHNPYQVGTYKRAWRKGFKREKGLDWIKRNQIQIIPVRSDPNAHLGGVAA